MKPIAFISEAVVNTLKLPLTPNTPVNPKDGSILFVKLYEAHGEYIRVAVRVSSNGRCYAKTLHLLSTCNAERYLEKGTLKSLTQQGNDV